MFEEIEKQWTKDSDSYDDLTWKQLKNRKLVTHWKKVLTYYLGSSPLKILEVGCGPGFLSILLAEMGHTVKAIDGSEGMIERARKNMERRGLAVTLALEDGVTLPEEEENQYDVIISRDVVWTLYDPLSAFRRWEQVLKPGGKLLYFDGNYQELKLDLRTRMWIHLSDLLILITEHKRYDDAAKGTDGSLKVLPLSHCDRPNEDKKLLAQAGFAQYRIRMDRWLNNPWSLDYLKYGYMGEKFQVIARKRS